MKKTLIISFLLLLIIDSYAQVVYDFDKEKALMESVIELQDIHKKEAYERAKIWMASTLKSSDNQIFSDDENNESLIGTGNLILSDRAFIWQRVVNFKLAIYFKDGKYKYILSEMVYHWVYGNPRQNGMITLDTEYKHVYSKKKLKKNEFHIEIDEAFEKLVRSLNEAINQKTPSKSDDW